MTVMLSMVIVIMLFCQLLAPLPDLNRMCWTESCLIDFGISIVEIIACSLVYNIPLLMVLWEQHWYFIVVYNNQFIYNFTIVSILSFVVIYLQD